MSTLSPGAAPASSRRLPDEALRAATRASDLAACRARLSGGSRTFLAASLLLPAGVRAHACALYAFCREADDAIDAQEGGPEAIDSLRERLALVYAGTPLPLATDRALTGVVARCGVPRAFFEALLEGFEWDARGRRYETLEALHDYATRVAGSVGAMMALVMGVRSPQGVARACELGVAMQLSNIARDVGEDGRMGRLYLPRQWLREAGIDPDAWLAAPVFTPALGTVVQRVVSAADLLYRRVDAASACIPVACRPGIRAARLLYAEIGQQVLRNGFDSVSRRARVTRSRKLALLLAALAHPFAGRAAHAEPLAGTAFLVDAVRDGLVRDAVTRESTHRRGHGRRMGGRVAWTIDLFTRLEQRDRALSTRGQPGRA